MKISFSCLPFDDLTLQELYDIMSLRQEVFIVEQNCPYLDADGKDQHAWHLSGTNSAGQLIAYARLLPKGVSYTGYASIGRVVTAPSVRRSGAGRLLMQETIRICLQLFGPVPLKISAQEYLREFYASFGFDPIGETYLEDGIPHIAMIRDE
jgi:ElaA protein